MNKRSTQYKKKSNFEIGANKFPLVIRKNRSNFLDRAHRLRVNYENRKQQGEQFFEN